MSGRQASRHFSIWRPYVLELGGALALYAVLLVASVTLLRASPARHDGITYALALLPVPGLLACCWAILRQLRRVDELQRRVQFEAIGLAFAATALCTMAYGFLENVGFPKLSMFFVWPTMALFWVIGTQLALRRYR